MKPNELLNQQSRAVTVLFIVKAYGDLDKGRRQVGVIHTSHLGNQTGDVDTREVFGIDTSKSGSQRNAGVHARVGVGGMYWLVSGGISETRRARYPQLRGRVTRADRDIQAGLEAVRGTRKMQAEENAPHAQTHLGVRWHCILHHASWRASTSLHRVVGPLQARVNNSACISSAGPKIFDARRAIEAGLGAWNIALGLPTSRRVQVASMLSPLCRTGARTVELSAVLNSTPTANSRNAATSLALPVRDYPSVVHTAHAVHSRHIAPISGTLRHTIYNTCAEHIGIIGTLAHGSAMAGTNETSSQSQNTGSQAGLSNFGLQTRIWVGKGVQEVFN
ncbi:hypothetical protein FB451DRAFT_1177970 [Mycena latifolia]|nr:hypothetical protein FB451DRAFT_1177970 [Mycena latifolia]